MKYILIFVTLFVFSGCTPYETRVALGAVAGASAGALIADSTYEGYYPHDRYHPAGHRHYYYSY